jgi:hypothetical protein
MAGLYPDDQTISLFGKEVRWPRLDPSTHKFTSGSFSDPLDEPSFIPAETVNLILDNLQNLIAGMGQTPDNHDPNQLFKAMSDFYFPVGKMITQYPDEPSPIEAGLPGVWEIWSDRSILYGVSADPPPDFVDYYTLAGNSIPAGNTPVVCYHQKGGSWKLYQFIAQTAAYTVPPEIEPVKWACLPPDVIDERGKCGNALTDDDYEIGNTITSGAHAGMYITGIIVPGGGFWSIEGGFRPTFISGGVQEDQIRDIKGTLNSLIAYVMAETTGALSWENSFSSPIIFSGANPQRGAVVTLDASRVVNTGPDFSPGNLSTRLWRRVS